MEELIVLAVLLATMIPVASIVTLFLAFSARRRLDAIDVRLAALDALGIAHRLSALEAERWRLAASAALPAPAQESPEDSAAPDVTQQAAAPATDDLAAEPPASPPPLPAGPGVGAAGLEERFGTRWVVWAGGLALALGGVFLVRYSIEQGFIGPGVRIALGALLGAALTGAGEWLRRRDRGAGRPAAYIPGILTAAGTTVGYATVFAAYALYDFIGPVTAFVLLGIVALATLGAALLHGPALAALGLVGAEVSPLLVATAAPNRWALYVYIAVVTAAAFALARLRLWRWLAVTALAFGAAWFLPGVDGGGLDPAPLVFHVMAGFGLAALFIVAGCFLGPAAEPGRIDAVSSGAVAAYLSLAAWLVVLTGFGLAGLVPFALLTAAAVAVAWRSAAAAAALPVAAALAVLVLAGWIVGPELSHLVAPAPGADPSQADLALHFAFAAFFAGLFGTAGYLAPKRGTGGVIPLIWSASAVLTPLAILVALYYRIEEFERSLPFAAIATGLAAWFATASERLAGSGARPGVPAAAALHAAGAAAALALALTFALEKGWLTVGLALMAPAVAWVAGRRPLPLLRWTAAAMAVLVVARIADEPRIVGDDLGTTPLFNWLLYGYGAPALAFWTAGFLLRRRADDVPSRMLDAAAILFSVLFVVLEVRHFMTGGDIYAPVAGLAETASQLCVLLAMAIGLEWLRRRTGNMVHDIGGLIVAAAALLLVTPVAFGNDNPRISGDPVGGPVLNLILLGYGLPAVLAAVLALTARRTRPMPYRMAAAATAVGLALAYLTLETMRLYQGPALTGSISDAQSYTISAVWLAFGVMLLAIAVPLDSKPTRLASAAVIGITTARVFLFDMANLAGIWRALSFIGLGLVLVGIGYLYQRLLFPPRPAATP